MTLQFSKNLDTSVNLLFRPKSGRCGELVKDASQPGSFDIQAVVPARPRTVVLHGARAGSEKNSSVEIRARSERSIRHCEKARKDDQKQAIEFVVRDRYVVTAAKLGQGSYGTVYAGHDSLTETPLAIKVDKDSEGYLRKEGDIYKEVWKQFPKVRGFPKVYFQGDVNGKEVLVMERLGASIADYFDAREGRLSLKKTLTVGLQALERLERMHESGLVHCDVKPDNMVMGVGEDDCTVFLIDMGLARPFRSPEVELTLETSNAATGVLGTLLYAPAELLRNMELTRRDDLESLAYSLLHLVEGDLPWEALSHNLKNIQKVEMGKEIFWESQEFKEMPLALQNFFDIIRDMKHDEKPCYTALRRALQEGLDVVGCENDEDYEREFEMKIEGAVGSFFHTSFGPLMSSMTKDSTWSLTELLTKTD